MVPVGQQRLDHWVYMNQKKSLEMNNFFKSSSEDSDFKNISSKDYANLCAWLRDIHGQNIRLLNFMKIIHNDLQPSSPLGEPVELYDK